MSDRCIDLKRHFGDQYRVEFEDSYYADHGERARTEDPWLMVVLCQNGHIYPHSHSQLGASTDRCGKTANQLKRLACTTVTQDGSDGVNVIFEVTDFEKVAEIMKPRRRRRQTPEQRQASIERLAKYRFTPARQSGFKPSGTQPAGSGDKRHSKASERALR